VEQVLAHLSPPTATRRCGAGAARPRVGEAHELGAKGGALSVGDECRIVVSET
jgi:hypothetical protein